MFDFLRSKKLRPVFSSIDTDMHCHLLPGVDDGSKDINETILCLRNMYQLGFRRVFLTPHFQSRYPNDEEDIKKRFLQLKEQLKGMTDIPELVDVSGEYRFDPYFCRRPGVDKVMPLPGKTLLCEFSLHDNHYMPIGVFEEYIKQGYHLILAHPERYPYLSIHSEDVEKIKARGVDFQVNLLSLNGFYGYPAMKKGFEYIDAGLVDYIGTDLHNMRYANELIATSRNKTVLRLLEKHTFKNKSM